MRNIREYEFWDNDFFGAARRTKREPAEFWLHRFLGMTLATPPAFFAIGPILDIFLSVGWNIVLSVILAIMIGLKITNLSRVYKGHGLLESDDWQNYYNFRARAREYFSLPKEDRALYPANIIEIMRDPDLTKAQRIELDDQLKSLYNKIVERDHEKQMLVKRNVDIEHILEHVKESKKSLAVETDTYREFM